MDATQTTSNVNAYCAARAKARTAAMLYTILIRNGQFVAAAQALADRDAATARAQSLASTL